MLSSLPWRLCWLLRRWCRAPRWAPRRPPVRSRAAPSTDSATSPISRTPSVGRPGQADRCTTSRTSPGSLQAPAAFYTWLVQDLAERGYVVLAFDVQGQGQSETLSHDGTLTGVPSEQQTNFVDDTEDAISFMLSTPEHPYAGAVNPLW